MRTVFVSVGCLMGAGFLLGTTTTLAKIAPGLGITPLAFLSLSCLIAAGLLGILAWLGGHPPVLTGQTVRYFAIAGLLSFAGPNFLLFQAIPHVGAGFAALAIAFPPLITYAGALLLGIERFCGLRAGGVCLAMSGAVWLAALKFQAQEAGVVWILATLGAPVLLAAGNLYRTMRWPAGASPQSLAPGMLFASFFWLCLVSVMSADSFRIDGWSAGLGALVAAEGIAFAGMYWLFFILQKNGGPVFVSLLGSVASAVTIPLAIFYLGEPLPAGFGAGAALIFTGVAFLSAGALRNQRLKC